MKQKNLLISFSGGRTSAFMAYFLLHYPKFADYQKHIVFANTGMEHNATYDFVERCNTLMFDNKVIWLEARARRGKRGHSVHFVNYETAHRQKDIRSSKHPFRLHIEKYGFPSRQVRSCTRELKQRAIDKYMSDVAGAWVKAIGIRADELHRTKARVCEKGMEIIYPLADYIQASKEMIRNWWYRQVFDLETSGEEEGNCAGVCYIMSLRKKATAILKGGIHPEALAWLIEEEKKQGRIMDAGGEVGFLDLINMAADPDFIPHKDNEPAPFDYRLDNEMACTCGV